MIAAGHLNGFIARVKRYRNCADKAEQIVLLIATPIFRSVTCAIAGMFCRSFVGRYSSGTTCFLDIPRLSPWVQDATIQPAALDWKGRGRGLAGAGGFLEY